VFSAFSPLTLPIPFRPPMFRTDLQIQNSLHNPKTPCPYSPSPATFQNKNLFLLFFSFCLSDSIFFPLSSLLPSRLIRNSCHSPRNLFLSLLLSHSSHSPPFQSLPTFSKHSLSLLFRILSLSLLFFLSPI